MSFGLKITELRKSKGMTQEQLASELGVTRQTISKWELDQSTPELKYIDELSSLFEVTTDYLIKDNILEEAVEPSVKGEDNGQLCDNTKSSGKIVGGLVTIIAGILLFLSGIITSVIQYTIGIMGIGVIITAMSILVIIVGIEIYVCKKNVALKVLWTVWVYINLLLVLLVPMPTALAINTVGGIVNLVRLITFILLLVKTVKSYKKEC